jgi:hypothetical protein
MTFRRFWGSITGGADQADSRISFVVPRLELIVGGDLATIDVLFGARHVHFANDLSTAKLPESKYDAFLQGSASCCPAGVDFLGLALCWSRSYGRLALRNGCNLMEHPFEDAVMDRV